MASFTCEHEHLVSNAEEEDGEGSFRNARFVRVGALAGVACAALFAIFAFVSKTNPAAVKKTVSLYVSTSECDCGWIDNPDPCHRGNVACQGCFRDCYNLNPHGFCGMLDRNLCSTVK